MNPRYCPMESVKSALICSSPLIDFGSHLRIAAFAQPMPGNAKVDTIAIDSSLCSGQGKTINGLYIGAPAPAAG